MKKYNSVKFSFFFIVTSVAYANQPIQGRYLCVDTAVDSKQQCVMQLTKNHETYTNEAKCSDGIHYRGTGVYSEKSRTMALAGRNTRDALDTGIALLTFYKNGKVEFNWADFGGDTLNQWVCRRS